MSWSLDRRSRPSCDGQALFAAMLDSVAILALGLGIHRTLRMTGGGLLLLSAVSPS